MAAVSGKVARIKRTSIAATSSTDEAATLSTDGVTLSIDDAAKRKFNIGNSTSLKVYDHGVSTSVALGSTLYDVSWPVGQVVFRTARSTSNVYMFDLEYLTSSYLIGARGWTASVSVDMLDTTVMSTSATDPQWRTFKPGLSGADVTIDRLVSTGDTGPVFYDVINQSTGPIRLGLELISEDGVGRYEAYAYVSGDSVSASLDGLVEGSVSLQVDGTLHYTTI